MKKKTSQGLKAYTGRDWALVRILQGATKAAVHVDRKKKQSKQACRTKITQTAKE